MVIIWEASSCELLLRLRPQYWAVGVEVLERSDAVAIVSSQGWLTVWSASSGHLINTLIEAV